LPRLSRSPGAHLSLARALPNRDRPGLWCYFVRTSIYICSEHQAMRPSQGGGAGAMLRNSGCTPPGNPRGSRHASMKFRAYKTSWVQRIALERGLTFVSDASDEGDKLRHQGDRVLGAGCRFRNHGHTIRLNHPHITARGCINIAAARSLWGGICPEPCLGRYGRYLVPSIGTSRQTTHLRCAIVCTCAIRGEPAVSRAMTEKPHRSHWL